MRRTVAAGVAIALAACAGAVAADPSRPVLALTGGGGGTRLVAFDASTLAPVGTGPSMPEPAFGVEWARSPDGSMTALVPKRSERDERLFVVANGRRPRIVSRLALGGEDACRLAWPRRRRLLVVLTRGRCYAGVERVRLLVVDPVPGRIVSRRRLLGGGLVVATTPTRDGIALLVRGSGGTRLLVVASARTRSIPLPTLRAPVLPLDKAAGSSLGLAVDPSGRHAYVVEPGGAVTEVDVAAGTARAAAGRRPAAVTKGPVREVVQAVWVGRGLVAVTGVRRSPDGAPSPSGLALVDTRSGRARTLDAEVSRIAYSAGTLLAYQPVPFTGRPNVGLRAYTAAGAPRFHAARGDRVELVRTQDGHAYVAATGGSAVVDLATGRVRRAAPGFGLPWTLLAAG